MSWFNVLKGAYPSLQQIDKTLPVASGETGIVRGSCIYMVSATEFGLASHTEATDHEAYIYFCLVGQDDLVAGMAGTKGQGAPNGVAVITGLACGMPFEFETSEFDSTVQHSVGDFLTVGASGKLVAFTSGDNCIAQVTKAAGIRWVNDAIAVTGFRTGANMTVITARTMWVPALTV